MFHTGYCDIQGRRRTIEDFHTVHLHKDHQFFGVFDGHNTNFASKYASSALYKRIVKPLSDIDQHIGPEFDWKSQVELEMTTAFADLHDAYLDAMKNIPSTMMNKSGTTVTALFLTKKAVIIASVGDSRAVLSVGASFNALAEETDAIQLTIDHIASNPFERKQVERRGAHISEQGGILRVNGTLVLTRSIGDAHLAQYLSRSPHVTSMTVREVTEKCRPTSISNGHDMPCFIILASDGLWDVFSNQEAVQMVQLTLQPYGESWKDKGAMQEAAERLTQEAYVRGSTDNIGVCVVAVT
jgi:Serine/threonine protein phosphatase